VAGRACLAQRVCYETAIVRKTFERNPDYPGHIPINGLLWLSWSGPLKRRSKSSKETPLEETRETEGDAPPWKETGGPDPQLSGVVDPVILEDALKQLPRGYKKFFPLRDFWGYEYHEIAAALGLAGGTSKSQLHKERMLLRRLLNSGSSPNPVCVDLHAR
jgi:DNA-directed RNA polymerase specialized sigma24 family protein